MINFEKCKGVAKITTLYFSALDTELGHRGILTPGITAAIICLMAVNESKDSPNRENLLSTYFRALKELEEVSRYIKNAEKNGDKHLSEFFREIVAQDRLRAWRAEEFLRRNLS